MRRFLLIALLFLILNNIYAYNRQELEKMEHNPEWIVGEGCSSSESKSDQLAIKDLLSQITIQVQASFTDIITEENGNVAEFTSSAMNSYSSARLDAAERSVFEEDGDYIVYRYIKKEDRNKIFTERERLIKDYARRGHEAEEESRIGDALMNYYWSLILLRTHPEWGKIIEEFENETESLISYLPERIRRIFSFLEIDIISTTYDEKYDVTLVNLAIAFNGTPVKNLDLKYYLGNNWSVPVGANQGKVLLEFNCKPDEIPDPLKINILYNDISKASHNNDLRKIIEEVACPEFRECRYELRNNNVIHKKIDNPQVSFKNKNDSLDMDFYKTKIDKVCLSILNKDKTTISDLLTEQGKEYYERILSYGNARLLEENPALTIDKIDNKVTVRGLPVQFNFPNSDRKFVEQLVFMFDENDKIERINFALSEEAIKDIVGNICATPMEKFLIVNFIEQYKTAYCTEDIGFIEKVFDEDALIIVGHVLKSDNKDIGDMYNKLGRDWNAVRYSKSEYIRNLKSMFAGNEYVNLHFEDNRISRTNNENSRIFGIQIHQYYYSQRYADEGYLFLMFDLADSNAPRIYVRTWQPEKNPDGSIYGLGDFYLPNK